MFGTGDTLLACPTGVFGERIARIAKMGGGTVEPLETPGGAGVDPEALAVRLRADRENKITGILLTHNETSTAVQIDLGAMSRAIGDHPAYVVVDSVSGLGASEFKMDEGKLDIVCAASQKALACPPGLAMVAVSARAWEKIKANKAPRFYFDLRKHKESFDKVEPPWTPPVSVAFALDVAIDLYEREGGRNVWARHARYTHALHEAVKALGMEVFSRDGVHSVTVTGILTPHGLDNATVLTKLLNEHSVVISGGQGKMAGKMWRWGTMGAFSEADLLDALRGFETVIRQMGYAFAEGAGVNAARDVFARSSKKELGEGAHRSPTPHLSGHLALSAGDHDAVLVEQFRQNCRVVEAMGRQNARDGDRMHAVAREHLHPERLDGFMKRVRVARVTGPDVAAAFPFVQIDCDVEGKGDGDRGRPRRLALVEELLVLAQIEVEARRLVGFDLLPCARTHRDHRQSRWARQRLLRRSADDIELPLVHLEFARAQAAHRVDHDIGGGVSHRGLHHAH